MHYERPGCLSALKQICYIYINTILNNHNSDDIAFWITVLVCVCHCVSGKYPGTVCVCACLCGGGNKTHWSHRPSPKLLEHPTIPQLSHCHIVAHWWVPMFAKYLCVISSLCLDDIYIYLFIPRRKLTARGKHHLSLIFNTLRLSVAIGRSHGLPLYLCPPVTQSGLGICHLPLRPVHRTDRILAGTRRSHPAVFPLKLCSVAK